ncbi:MAG TPA: hypothetical protein VN924_05820 [Bryobacteraceae bacterium]|jgi:hypothetical protein|nr:hypothetical protein [Bryobacteraceae bacterium]
MSKTAVGLFENPGVADQVVHDLDTNSFPRKEIRVIREPLGMAVTEVTSIPHTDFEVGLDRDLKAIGASQEEAGVYVREVRRGGVLVFATGTGPEVDDAAEIMSRHGAMKVEELIGREPTANRTTGESLPLSRGADAPAVRDATQTGRIRQSGDGVRMFVW